MAPPLALVVQQQPEPQSRPQLRALECLLLELPLTTTPLVWALGCHHESVAGPEPGRLCTFLEMLPGPLGRGEAPASP